MAPGESRRFWIPAELAFGTNATALRSAKLLGKRLETYAITVINVTSCNVKEPRGCASSTVAPSAWYALQTLQPSKETTKPTGPLVFDIELYSIERPGSVSIGDFLSIFVHPNPTAPFSASKCLKQPLFRQPKPPAELLCQCRRQRRPQQWPPHFFSKVIGHH